MPRTLYIGDPHVTPEEIADCENLVRYVAEVVREKRIDTICFLGDQHHTHSVLRLEVVAFWLRTFEALRVGYPGTKIVTIVGNHDMPGDTSETIHAMMCYGGSDIVVVDKPTIVDGVLHMPYYHDREAFVRDCNLFAHIKELVCHQTFDGSKYENGFPAKDGVNADLLPQTGIISGHIHTMQRCGKVWYPGTPRWRIATDANVEKAIWVVDRYPNGERSTVEPLDTSKVCRAMYHFKVTPDQPAPSLDVTRHKYLLDVEGPSEWVDAQVFPPEVRLRVQRVEAKTVKVRESEGIEKSFRRFVEGYEPAYGTPREQLVKLAEEKFGV